MKVVQIPTWAETEERLEQLERSDRTIAQCVLGGDRLDPIESFINNQEPAGRSEENKFRGQLQEMLDFVANNY